MVASGFEVPYDEPCEFSLVKVGTEKAIALKKHLAADAKRFMLTASRVSDANRDVRHSRVY